MKLILAVLALACTAYSFPYEQLQQQFQGAQDSCPGRCFMQDKYRTWFTEAAPKARAYAKQVSESGDASAVFPHLHPEKWGQYCTEVTSVRTCIGACNDAADADKKAKAEAILTAAADIVCDAEIKAKFTCLQDVVKVPSPTCNTQCEQFKAPIEGAINTAKTTGAAPDWESAKTTAKNVCLLLNCRLKCRKPEFEQKCQADGYAAGKKLVKKLAALGKTTHAQFRPAANFPTECEPEKLVEGA